MEFSDSYGLIDLVRIAAPAAGQVSDPHVEYLLQRATDLLDDAIPTLRARADADPALRDRVDRVATDMVARVLRNPDGARSRTSTRGPFSESVTFGDTTSEMVLTDAERLSLLPPGKRAPARRSIGSIRLRQPW